MGRINFCIILFNKSLGESKSFKSLESYFSRSKALAKVVVFNNGPRPVKVPNYDWLVINQILINGSLSKIYNKFIEEYPSEKYVFLDDDTELTKTYLDELVNKEFNIFLPKISCMDTLYYPVINNSKIQSVTSGLVLSSLCVDTVKSFKESVFDERFDLYGIDTAFFYTVNKYKLEYMVSESIIEHELSHISSGTNDFREIEVLLANSAALFPYFSLRLLLSVVYGNLKMLSRLRFNVIISSVSSILLKRTIRLWKF